LDEEVNAFQRYSSVILQRSIREGFGFTVTEAMWKNQPVVGTSVTGLRMQITHGYNGYLVDDTKTAAEYTQKLLTDREHWRELGENAHETVRKRFLFPTLILGYVQTLRQACTRSSKRSESEIVCRDTTVADVEIAA
jgi:trehalose synthase